MSGLSFYLADFGIQIMQLDLIFRGVPLPLYCYLERLPPCLGSRSAYVLGTPILTGVTASCSFLSGSTVYVIAGARTFFHSPRAAS